MGEGTNKTHDRKAYTSTPDTRDWYHQDLIMSSTYEGTSKKDIEEIMLTLCKKSAAPKLMLPIRDPTKLEVIQFKTRLIDALAKCEGHSHDTGGHIHILTDLEEYQRRVGDPAAEMPKVPTIPKYSRDNNEELTETLMFFIKEAKVYDF